MDKATILLFVSNREALLYQSLRIRMVEEKIIELYPTDLIQSPVHLSIGQEAVAVGVCSALSKDDLVFINYRGHAFYLAKGGPLPEFFAELMGRSTGICKGKAGSMHLAAPSFGVMGASAVVASTIPHAVGAALANKLRGLASRNLTVANFGDGAMEQGVFFESLNFASLHNLPVLFLCEDNGLAVHSPKNERQAFELRKLVNSFGILYFSLDEGYDPEKVLDVTRVIVSQMLSQSRPAFLRVTTARYKEHVGTGEDFDSGYRSKDEVDKWKKLDPLLIEENSFLMNQWREGIREEISAAVQFAIASPFPTRDELLTDVI